MKIAILGAGSVGGTLGKAWANRGHQVTFAVRNPEAEKTQTLLQEIGDRKRMALLVYDMQVGIMNQLPKERGEKITANIVKVLQAAREAGVRVFFLRHMSLPLEAAGVFQLRMAMAWQRVDKVSDVKPWFLRDTPDFELIPELSPLPSEVIFDKIKVSFSPPYLLPSAFLYKQPLIDLEEY